MQEMCVITCAQMIKVECNIGSTHVLRVGEDSDCLCIGRLMVLTEVEHTIIIIDFEVGHIVIVMSVREHVGMLINIPR